MDAHHRAAGATMPEPGGSPGSGSPVLTVHDVIKDYDGQRALDCMDLEVRAGEVHALLGENGAGKSTLIKAVAGVIPYESGSVRVAGEPLAPSDPQASRHAGVAVVHQHGNLVPALSVGENLLLGEGFPRRTGVLLDRRRMDGETRGMLEQVGLAHISPRTLASDLKPHEAGMLAVAKALRTHAKLIVLDEPTTAFTPHEVEVLFERLRSLKQEGTAFIYVSHRLAEVLEISDRITVMREGRRIGTWDRGDLTHDELVDHLVGDERLAHKHADDQQARSVARGAPVVEIRGLRSPTLRGVDVTVHEHEVLGLAGLPGSGAAEVLNVLFGLVPREGGDVELDGKPVKVHDPVGAREAGFALIPKDRHAQAVLPGQSVRENVTIASTGAFRADPVVRWMKRGAERAKTKELVSQLTIKTRGGEQDISSLSGGNQQKVVLARWLTRGSRVFLFDDPCAGVDIQSKKEIYDLIGDLAAEGHGVVVTSTELEELVRACHRVVVLFEGEVVGELVGDQITEQSILRLSFGRGNEKENANGSGS
jgi:ABC-type sugar transport system ATPase subunit